MGAKVSKPVAVVADPVVDVSASSVAADPVVDVSSAPVVQDVSAVSVVVIDVSSSDVSIVSVVSDASGIPVAPVSGSEIKKPRSYGLCCSKNAVAIVTSDKAEAVVSPSPEQTIEKKSEPTVV